MSDQPTLYQRWADSRPSKTALFWSCVLCIGLTMLLGFTWGGWVTSGTATRMQAEAATRARTELAAAVCVHRFLSAKDAAAQLSSLKTAAAWKRSKFIEDGGWSAFPGAGKPVEDVAVTCAQRLLEAPAPQPDQASEDSTASGQTGKVTVQ